MPCALALLRGELIFCGARFLLEEADQHQVDGSGHQKDVGDIADEESGIVDEIDNVTHSEAGVTK